MLVTLVGNNKIYRMRLSDNVEGNYWLYDDAGDEKSKLVNIRSYKGRWIVSSSKYSKIIDQKYIKREGESFYVVPSPNAVIKAAALKEYSKMYVSLRNQDEIYVLYAFPSYERNYTSYEIINDYELKIGSDFANDIMGRDDLLSDVHAHIFKRNGNWYIENYNSQFGTFVNSSTVGDDTEQIKNGDIIFICGLKLMLIGNIISIYGPADKVKVSHKNLSKREMIGKKQLYKEPEELKDEEVELYQENDYFYRAPRIIDKIGEDKVNIDQPPQIQSQQNNGNFLAVFASMAMSTVTIVTFLTTISGISSGQIQGMNIAARLATAIAMLCTVLLIPIIRAIVNKNNRKKQELKRQVEYKKYINSNIIKINNIMEKQGKILKKNYMSAEQCERVILEKSPELWERKISDFDFLNINLGNGNRNLDLGITKVEPKFSLTHDNLQDIYYDVVNKSRTLKDVPITTSLTEKNVAAIISKDKKKIKDYMENVVLQLITLQSYTDLKLVFFVKDEEMWEYAKLLPHTWDNARKIRFFATNRNDVKMIAGYLEEIMNERTANEDNGLISISRRDKDYKSFETYYLIITDNYNNLHNVNVINRIIESEENVGFSLLCTTDDITQLPTSCKEFIELDGKNCVVYENETSSTDKQEFTLEKFEKFDYDKIAKVISNIPIKVASTKATNLPDRYNFLEMFNCGNIEQLNVFDRWNNNDSTQSLQAQIGVDASGNTIYLDAHEKYHGPHGLIAGTTGSGKSEFIITYVLSLAINYHPDDVTFVLIDYKGGGVAGAFKKKNIQLPHLVGTITNIDSVGLQRSLESIQSELRRRQVMFNEAKNITNESTIDIYKYQKLYHEGTLKTPISHLFIICDEFAELKQQQPDFMAELMSVSRIGRSLGVHLILATQKPAGIVNDQIRSNSKFGVCLKVQDRSDSKDIIKRPDAATLKNAGQFYINVGNDEYFALGQSGYTGVPYVPSEMVKKDEDNSVAFISETGNVIKRIEDKVAEVKDVKSRGDQLTNVVKYLDELANRKEINEKQLWLDPIPANIYVNSLRKKYGHVAEHNVIAPIIGEYDDPFNQLQGIVTLNLSKDGNTVIYGSADSGKELVLNSIIYDCAVTHSPEEVQLYCLDFGNEALRMFRGTPQVGDVILSEDIEKISRLITFLKAELKERKRALVEYNGNYNLYLKTSGKNMPLTVVIINDGGAFIQSYPEYEEEITTMSKDCIKYGIVFVITANAVNDLRMRMTQNFKKKVALQLIGDDYSYVFSKARRKKPSSLNGRGLITINDNDEVYEFQTAQIYKQELLGKYVTETIKKLNDKYKISAPSIPVLPSKVTIEDVKHVLKGIKSVPLGINSNTIKPLTYDFTNDTINIIATKDIEDIKDFIVNLCEEISTIPNVDFNMFDENELISQNEGTFVERFNKFTIKLNENAQNKGKRHIVYIILGINKFIQSLGPEKERFTRNVENGKSMGNCSFIVIDNSANIKAMQFESWYKDYVVQGNGLWIGDGFDSQYVINYEADRRSIKPRCGISFGYVVKKNKPTLIKMLGLQEKSEENE